MKTKTVSKTIDFITNWLDNNILVLLLCTCKNYSFSKCQICPIKTSYDFYLSYSFIGHSTSEF